MAPQAVTPFRFHTSLTLPEATGLRAATLPQLAQLLRQVPERCVYYHTHEFLRAHQYLTPEPTNDFAYWVAEVLGEEPLGERLTGIDTIEYPSLEALRQAIAGAIEQYVDAVPQARLKFVSEHEEFHFITSTAVIMPTARVASTLGEFAEALEHVSIHSLYFHTFDARLRLGGRTNDFARWLREQLGLDELAGHLEHLDPYAHTLETLRALMLSLIRGVARP